MLKSKAVVSLNHVSLVIYRYAETRLKSGLKFGEKFIVKLETVKSQNYYLSTFHQNPLYYLYT